MHPRFALTEESSLLKNENLQLKADLKLELIKQAGFRLVVQFEFERFHEVSSQA